MVLYETEDLTDKCVLITGATAGIGEACAYRFAEAGCRLILLGRRTDRLSHLRAALQKMFPTLPQPFCVTFDVQNIDKVAELASTFPADYQDIDILVNNAGLALGTATVTENAMADVATMGMFLPLMSVPHHGTRASGCLRWILLMC